MPRRKKGRDKAHGKRRSRKKSDGFVLNVRPYRGPKVHFVPREEKKPVQVWPPPKPTPTTRAFEDIIALSVLDGKENPVSKLAGEGNEHPKGDEKK